MDKPEQLRASSTLSKALKSRDTIRVRALGVQRMVASDAYHQLMRLSWPRIALLFASCFFVFNLFFAALYRLDPGGLALPHETPEFSLFWRDFFFSVHTVATIGYGNVYPISLYTNVIVVAEITCGILFFALTTGIVFARFSRPTARILFSEVLVVREIDGVPTLMLRAANQRHNLIYSAHVKLSLLQDEDVGGTRMRRFCDLRLLRESNPVFALTWTVMHPIDDDSPLRGWLADRAAIGNSEIIVVLSGSDESSGQTIHGRWAYGADDIRWNARFEDIISVDDHGTRTIDYDRFHTVTAMSEPLPS
ncbi:MAG TPA: ion channel [Novosphingobium sp.]|nr:ion channel [Novosphingobium sp.]